MRRLGLAAVTLSTSVCLVLGTGCAEEPKRKREVQSRKKSRPEPKLTPPQPPEPVVEAPSEPPPPEPEIDRPVRQWWCLCYQQQGAGGPEPVTACRGDLDQCQKLERRVAKGSDSIVAESVSFNCRSISGTHPSDAIGTFEQWQPSKLDGAWVSEGTCWFAVADPSEEPAPEAPPEPTGDPLALLRSELIGDLAVTTSSAAIRHQLGQPLERGSIDELAATGTFEQVWTYADGLTVVMQSDTRSGPQSLSGVIIEAPSTLKTRRGIGLGASWDAVERAYGDVRAPEDDARDADVFVAGSTAGGLRFEFERDAVVKIVLGAFAQ